MATVLVVDDEPSVRDLLWRGLQSAGHRAVLAGSAEAALSAAAAHPLDAAVIDIRLPDMTGVDVLPRLRRFHPQMAAVALTGFGSVAGAVEALHRGFADYLEKPFDVGAVLKVVESAMATPPHRPSENTEHLGFEGLVGSSPEMLGVFRTIERVAATPWPVLVRGETGTGKELVARAIHHHSPRRDRPFVDVNCSNFPESLFDNEFFGHERGAFTDAVSAAPGKFEQANGGTLFLDEIGTLPLGCQAKLLRVLQNWEITRLGGREKRTVDVRLVTATNAALEDMVPIGGFREDLLQRLKVFVIRLPPLRERSGDVGLLVRHFLTMIAREIRSAPLSLTPAAEALLVAHSWPGNVRELEHVLRSAAIESDGHAIAPSHLPHTVVHSHGTPVTSPPSFRPGGFLAARERLVSQHDREWIEWALAKHGGHRARAAADLGIDPRTLRTWMRRTGLPRRSA